MTFGAQIGGQESARVKVGVGVGVGVLGGMVLGNILPDPIGDALHFLWAQPLLARNCVGAHMWPGYQCAGLQLLDWYVLAGLGWIILLLLFLPLSMRNSDMRTRMALARTIFALVGVFVLVGIMLNLYFADKWWGFGPRIAGGLG